MIRWLRPSARQLRTPTPRQSLLASIIASPDDLPPTQPTPKVAGFSLLSSLARAHRKGYACLPRASKNVESLKTFHLVWEDSMGSGPRSWPVDRRTILRTGAALAAVQFSSPFIVKARGETPVRIGMVDPLTGVYAAIAQGEVVGARFAVEDINKKGGILGRPV